MDVKRRTVIGAAAILLMPVAADAEVVMGQVAV
jgi:hypothetical protein